MDGNRYEAVGGSIRGGFGEVTPLLDRYLERTVIYKQMQNSSDAAQLKNEVAALVRARSQHIVEIYDVDLDREGRIEGIVIEYLSGRDYLNFHREAFVDANATTKIIYQISVALSELHAAAIVHRDLKLDNFRASSSGVVKLFDFGISTFADPHFTVLNRGTYEYAAPELYRDGAVITSAADVYALGVCCWKLVSQHLPPVLTGRPPLEAGAPPSLSSVAGYLDGRVARMVDQCLSLDPTARPTALEVARCCEEALLKNKHRGAFTRSKSNVQIYELSSSTPTVKITIPNLGELRAAYTGYSFEVVGTTGDVYMNNARVQAGAELLDACVITFGSFDRGADREYVSFLCSKPEVVL